jgi:predicted enzyme related to lactoylglutathione lyase
MDSGQMAMLPSEQGAVGGALFKGDGYKPSQDGAVLYLNGGDDLSHVLNRVAGAGGQVIMPKTGIGENGFIAFFFDTEGNKVGLHSMG